MSGERSMKRRRSECSHLSRDVIHEILLRLPVTSVLKFRCVSKLFAAVSTEPSFISSHTERCKERPDRSLILHQTNGKILCIFGGVDKISTISLGKDIVDMFDGPSELILQLVASCDGLLCFSDNNDADLNEESYFVVGNPLTGGWTTVKLLIAGLEVLGFYFHKSSNSYRILLLKGDYSELRPRLKYWVLTLGGSQTLRPIKSFSTYTTVHGMHYEPVIMHNKLHHLGHLAASDDKKMLIVVFDLETEQFSHIPVLYDFKYVFDPVLIEIRGKLCIYNSNLESCSSVLVLEDYESRSWIVKQVVFEDRIDKGIGQSYIPITYAWSQCILLAKSEGDNDTLHGKKITFFKLWKKLINSEGLSLRDFSKIFPVTKRYTQTLAVIHNHVLKGSC